MTATNIPVPPIGGRTAAQSPNFPVIGGRPFGVGAGGVLGSGGCAQNPMGYQGWGAAYAGTYDVYRWILQHPTVRAVRSVVFSPIISNTWTYEADDDVPPEALEFIQRTFDRLRWKGAVKECLRGLDYGCAKFEVVWERDDNGLWNRGEKGYYYIDYLKPLRIDTTAVYDNPDGSLGGFAVNLKEGVEKIEQPGDGKSDNPSAVRLDLAASNCTAWMYTHDGEAGNLHGRSRLENIRETAWSGWLTTAQQIALTGGKISGRNAHALVPAGGYTFNGVERTYAQDAIDAAGMFLLGQIPVLTYPTPQDAQGNIIKTEPLVKFEVDDFGDNGPAIKSFLDMLAYWDSLIFLGWLRSPRTGLEGTHGTKAEAESHGSTGDYESEVIDDDIAGQMQPLVDRVGALNWKLRPGSVRIKPSPIVDRKAARAMQLIQTLAASQPGALLIAQHLDVRKTLESLDAAVTELGESNTSDVLADAKNTLPDPANQPAKNGENGNPAMNGNGRMAVAVAGK